MLGRDIAYSRSPDMQNAAFRALGLDWTYELLDVTANGLPAALTGLRRADVAGANVTIPYKQVVMGRLDSLDPEAVRARAVNTIVRDGDRLVGSNTDIAAIRSAVAGVGVEPGGAKVVVFGVGGSARAAAVALEGAHVTFVSRHPQDADVPGRTIGWEDGSLHSLVREADLLVNATPLGRREEMPIRPAALPRDGAIIDLVYVTGGTPLVRKARSLGLRTADGWEILLAQGARSFQMWTGRPAPESAMRETLQP
ncbi:MAG: shikimate dehydrogenase family protein [Candidatus Dormibacteraceae bacterium]